MTHFQSNAIGVSLFVLVSLIQCYYCLLIEDFGNSEVRYWKEISDGQLHHGKSVSSFVTRTFKEGQITTLLFTLLVPCEQNASFAGIMKPVSLDISDKSNVILNIKNQGEYNGYEFILRHHDDFGDSVPSYVTYFKAPKNKFAEILLPIDEFKAYRKGQLIPDAKPLNKRRITAIGVLAYGGAHRLDKQMGVASLEIKSIKVE